VGKKRKKKKIEREEGTLTRAERQFNGLKDGDNQPSKGGGRRRKEEESKEEKKNGSWTI